jgi:hypothetical protein
VPHCEQRNRSSVSGTSPRPLSTSARRGTPAPLTCRKNFARLCSRSTCGCLIGSFLAINGHLVIREIALSRQSRPPLRGGIRLIDRGEGDTPISANSRSEPHAIAGQARWRARPARAWQLLEWRLAARRRAR